ncbi:hypothetical protein PDESU_04421 [Pontiella desulfatans]|uniref:STAS domain-containing protein n=1 Tax=Pontiella desulfatans TaxID=2750659 RepID=A0A6C2U8W7_PONDE|nr:hypothetical protein [Pontiella desulfatans]VGO15834.1 hypothetical protein PDESU_04421 [Pontiella desulfatans]
MYLLEIDQTHNRTHLTLSDHFDESEAKSLLDEFQQRIGELKPDFHVLCDLTTLDEFESEARTHFRELMDYFNGNGVRKIIRITSKPLHDFGLTVMSHFHYGNDVHVITCETFKEAQKHL